MNYKKIISDSFSTLTPLTTNDEIIRNVTERAEKMENKRRISIRKPVIAICAAVAAVALGTVGAAAAGLINFNEIFGSVIRTDNAELGKALIGNAENVEWSVSDEKYVVNLKGVTGTNERVMAVVEIARADGTPVEEFFKHKDIIEETFLYSGSNYMGLSDPEANLGKSIFTYINEKGNIEVNYQVYLGAYDTNGVNSLNGQRIIMEGMGFYSGSTFKEATDIGGYNLFSGNGNELSEASKLKLEEISELFLEWSMEFDYVPSETSAKTYTVSDLSQSSYFECDVEQWNDKDGNGEFEADAGEIEIIAENERFEIMFDKITVNCIGGTFSAKADLGEYAALGINIRPWHSDGVLDIEFIKNDGTESEIMIIMTSGSAGCDFETGIMECTYDFEYHNGVGQTAVDLSEISAISINGTVYNLE